MPVHVGKPVFHDWKAIEYPPAGWTDIFIFSMQSDAGLPPDDYVDSLKNLKPAIKIYYMNRLLRTVYNGIACLMGGYKDMPPCLNLE